MWLFTVSKPEVQPKWHFTGSAAATVWALKPSRNPGLSTLKSVMVFQARKGECVCIQGATMVEEVAAATEAAAATAVAAAGTPPHSRPKAAVTGALAAATARTATSSHRMAAVATRDQAASDSSPLLPCWPHQR